MRALALLLVAAAGSACIPPYRPPTADSPHAIVKIRRVYETRQGTTLHERLLIEQHVALTESVLAAETEAPRIDAVLVHPRAAALEFKSVFLHTEMRTVQESYIQQVPYTTTETYSCGSYSGGKYTSQTCTRTVTRYRSETRYRTVTKQVEVIDGACAEALWLVPEVGHTYLLQYTYHGHSACHLSCFEQIPTGNGQFENRACPVPAAAVPVRSEAD